MELDCGDNSCMFAKSKKGMRTNGGCRCLEIHGFHRSQLKSMQMMLPEILALRETLKEAKLASQNGDVEQLKRILDTV